MELQKILSYLTKYCRLSSLPSYNDLKHELIIGEESKTNSGYGRNMGNPTPLFIPTHKILEKEQIITKIISHLSGGESRPLSLFHDLEIKDITEITYADHKPLKVTINFSGDVERIFYAKTSVVTCKE